MLQCAPRAWSYNLEKEGKKSSAFFMYILTKSSNIDLDFTNSAIRLKFLRSDARCVQVEAEKVKEGIFVVKMRWRSSASGGAALVQRVIESLHLELTSTAVYQMAPNQMLTTAFLQVIFNLHVNYNSCLLVYMSVFCYI